MGERTNNSERQIQGRGPQDDLTGPFSNFLCPLWWVGSQQGLCYHGYMLRNTKPISGLYLILLGSTHHFSQENHNILTSPGARRRQCINMPHKCQAGASLLACLMRGGFVLCMWWDMPTAGEGGTPSLGLLLGGPRSLGTGGTTGASHLSLNRSSWRC